MNGVTAVEMAQRFDLEWVDVCVLCGTAESRQVFRIPPFAYRKCVNCGLIRLCPRIAAAEITNFYQSNYDYAANAIPLGQQLSNPTFVFRARRLERHAPGRRFFELGCGDGNFLAVLRSRGWIVAGSDVIATAAHVAWERHGISVQVSPVGAIDIDQQPDAVGLYHVLEHIYTPRDTLRAIHQMLAPNAIVHIQIPNIRSVDGRLGRQYWWALRCPEHVYFYEPRHLSRLLIQEGFIPLSLETYDPWHGPGTIEITTRSLVKAGLRRLHCVASPSSRESPDSPTSQNFDAARRAIHNLVPVDFISRSLARLQATLGLGNVVDIVATRV